MAVDKSLVSGSTTMLVLKLLEEKDMYGYEMIDTIRGKSKNVFELKAGVGKIRKYYHITRSGKKELKKKSEEWKEYSKAVLDVMGGVCFG